MTKAKRAKLHKHILSDYDIMLVGDERHIDAFRREMAALRSLAYAAAVALHSTVLPPAPHNDAFFAALRADTLPLPALYIYSDDDVVTDAATLTEFVAWRRARHPLGPQRGVSELHITQPSAHVSHYRSHKARYVAAVRDFLATARDGFASREGVGGSGGGARRGEPNVSAGGVSVKM